MLILSVVSALLIFITMGMGLLTRRLLEKVFRSAIQSDLLGIFLLGLIASTFYFSIISFWWPVNYLSLIPLAILSAVVFIQGKENVQVFRQSVRNHLHSFFSRPHRLITLSVLALLFIGWVLPPSNQDSPLYHYLSILWYEKYKVIPGLANVHGRFAFNPASFIIGSAYSFTGPAGQSLYPLNGVLIGLLVFWLLARLFRSGYSPASLAGFALIVLLYRPLLINMSSPTSDVLVAICIVYVFIRLYGLLPSGQRSLSALLVPALVILYSLICKLSSFPVLLILPYLFSLLPGKEKRISLLLKVGAMALVIYLPWMVRNYILSGYFIYPLPGTDWFHPDWKVAPGAIRYELYLINVMPKTGHQHVIYSTPLPFRQWVSMWFNTSLRTHAYYDLILFLLSILSPLYWLITDIKKTATHRPVFVLWLALYASVWIWFFTSPAFRFGAIAMILSTLLPFMVYAQGRPAGKKALYGPVLNGLIFFSSLYYIVTGYIKPSTYPFTLKDCWLLPLKDIGYQQQKKQMADFPYRTLNTGVKIYLSDDYHQCINACLPCMEYDYGIIEMRGTRMDEGFRSIRDETLSNFPFLR